MVAAQHKTPSIPRILMRPGPRLGPSIVRVKDTETGQISSDIGMLEISRVVLNVSLLALHHQLLEKTLSRE